MTRLPLVAIIYFAIYVGSSPPAAAHPGSVPTGDLLAGLLHPLSGIDHLTAMVALGFWAAAMGGRALWLLPLAFLLSMALGGFSGQMNLPLPLTEAVILASSLLLPTFALLRIRLHHWVAVALTIVVALAHGHAHGTELPAHAAALLYGTGFVAATAVLHLSGIFIAHLTSRTEVRARRATS